MSFFYVQLQRFTKPFSHRTKADILNSSSTPPFVDLEGTVVLSGQFKCASS